MYKQVYLNWSPVYNDMDLSRTSARKGGLALLHETKGAIAPVAPVVPPPLSFLEIVLIDR